MNSSVRETDESRNSHVAIVVVFFTRSGCVGDLTSIMSVAISTYTWTLKPPLRKSESVLMVSCSLCVMVLSAFSFFEGAIEFGRVKMTSSPSTASSVT